MKIILGISIIVSSILIAINYSKLNLFIFSENHIKTTTEPIEISKVFNLMQLLSTTYFDEFIVKETRNNTFIDDKLVMIVKSKIIAEINLDTTYVKNFKFINDTLFIKIPHSEIISNTINPSQTEVFIEQGDWGTNDYKSVIKKAKIISASRAQSKNILAKSDDDIKDNLLTFFKSVGIQNINLSYINR